jgi:hypothetical protein
MHKIKLLWRAFLVFVLVNALVLVGTADFGVVQVSAEAPGLIVIITSDTTWTKADSPYNLTGPILVDGVTLTIEAGVTVTMNDYDILVHGTLRAIGSSSEKVLFDHGTVKFSEYSNGWDEQTDSGCVFEYCVLNFSAIVSNVSLKLTNSDLGMMYLGDSSLVSNNLLLSDIEAGNFNNISNNYCWHDITVEDSNLIYNNNASRIHAGNSNLIYNNVIRMETEVGQSNSVYNNNITGEISVGVSSEFLNNTVNGIIESTASVIANNTIIHPTEIVSGYLFDYFVSFKYNPAIEVSGTSEITNNVIIGPGRNRTTSDGYGIKVEDGYSYISGNVFFDYDVAINAEDGATIRGNLFVNNSRAVVITRCSVVVRNNTITGGNEGIVAYAGGSVTIDRNLISNHSVCGVYVECQTTIRNNTITDNPIAIKFSECPLGEIVYNNFENYSQYSIYFETSSSNFDFTNNWWGLTDTQAINMTIHDFKYDFNSAKVNFVPFLTKPNPEALPLGNLVIPEFPSWLLLPLFLVASFVVVVVRRRLVC